MTIMPEIYHYIDYRAYLKDCFDERKKKNRNFSHQYFARKAGIKSTGFVLHVIKGERNLTRPVMLKIARAIGLNSKQTQYFEDIVFFDQARSQSEKDYYFGRITEKRNKIKVKTLDDRQYEFYSAWYHSVIRELITMAKTNQETQLLSKLLVPPVSAKQVRKSLNLQKELGILKKKQSGGYVQTAPFISGGGPVRNVAVINFQKAMLKHAIEAWDRFENREISMNTVTFCMSEDLLERVKQEIRDFKKKLFQIIGEEKKKPERVFQLNLNLFPVTKPVKGSKK
jgi:uncharacterized protein (TIGR02147 family)